MSENDPDPNETRMPEPPEGAPEETKETTDASVSPPEEAPTGTPSEEADPPMHSDPDEEMPNVEEGGPSIDDEDPNTSDEEFDSGLPPSVPEAGYHPDDVPPPDGPAREDDEVSDKPSEVAEENEASSEEDAEGGNNPADQAAPPAPGEQRHQNQSTDYRSRIGHL